MSLYFLATCSIVGPIVYSFRHETKCKQRNTTQTFLFFLIWSRFTYVLKKNRLTDSKNGGYNLTDDTF